MCRNFFPGISGGVLTPLTPPLDPPLALFQDPALKRVRVRDKNNNSCIMFIIFTSPKPEVLFWLCLFVCVFGM